MDERLEIASRIFSRIIHLDQSYEEHKTRIRHCLYMADLLIEQHLKDKSKEIDKIIDNRSKE